jgi:hypothetical protein
MKTILEKLKALPTHFDALDKPVIRVTFMTSPVTE